MSGLKEAFDDIAAEISPVDPPVELTMLQGKRIRNGRLAAVVGGTAGTVVLGVGALVGFPALAGHGGPASSPAGAQLASAGPAPAITQSANAAPLLQPSGAASGVPLLRPVLLESPRGSTAEYGNTELVDAATLTLFLRLACTPGPSAGTADDHWKAAIGYATGQWNAPDSQVVSCDAAGTKYVLGPAVVTMTQVTSVTTARMANNSQWGVDVTLDRAATLALGAVTKDQYNSYYPGSSTNLDDAALDSIAVVLNGDVYDAPLTAAPLTQGQLELTGPQPGGFATEAEAQAFVDRL
jgi:hypothetical protein